MENLHVKADVWDDLKFKTVACSKAIDKGDTLQYELIKHGMMTKPSFKGLALNSSSVKIFEKNLENEKKENCEKSINSDSLEEEVDYNRNMDSEVNSQIHSSKCYWEEIEPNLNERGVILDSSVPLKKEMFQFCTHDSTP
jgi:hypothetical protein